MKISKLIKGLAHIDEIYEGIKNNIFKKDDIEMVAMSRWMICKSCELIDTKGDECAVSGTQPCCSDCGCSLAFKMRSLSSSCPKGKWNALVTEEIEDEILKSINVNSEADGSNI